MCLAREKIFFINFLKLSMDRREQTWKNVFLERLGIGLSIYREWYIKKLNKLETFMNTLKSNILTYQTKSRYLLADSGTVILCAS